MIDRIYCKFPWYCRNWRVLHVFIIMLILLPLVLKIQTDLSTFLLLFVEPSAVWPMSRIYAHHVTSLPTLNSPVSDLSTKSIFLEKLKNPSFSLFFSNLICIHWWVFLLCVCLLLNGTSALFKLLVQRIVEIKQMRHIKTIWNRRVVENDYRLTVQHMGTM